ncbi:MAG: MOSC domain-containing protein [Planctomycetota bacterium]
MRSNTPRCGKEGNPLNGTVAWIGLRPAKRAEMEIVTSAEIDVAAGLVGDCHSGGAGHHRQITFFQMEHLPVVAALLGREIDPQMTRRNIGVSGINLLSLEGKAFRIGDAIVRYTEPCLPCGRMDQTMGEGGLAAMRGHGGIMASVVQGGVISVGAEVAICPDA